MHGFPFMALMACGIQQWLFNAPFFKFVPITFVIRCFSGYNGTYIP